MLQVFLRRSCDDSAGDGVIFTRTPEETDFNTNTNVNQTNLQQKPHLRNDAKAVTW